MNDHALFLLHCEVDFFQIHRDPNKRNPFVTLLHTAPIFNRFCALLLAPATDPHPGYVKKENHIVFEGDRKALQKLNATCSALNLLFKVTKPEVFLSVEPLTFAAGHHPRQFAELFNVLRASVIVNNCKQPEVLRRVARVSEALYGSTYDAAFLARVGPASFTEEQVGIILSQSEAMQEIVYVGCVFLQTIPDSYLLKFIHNEANYEDQDFIKVMDRVAPSLFWRLFHKQPYQRVRNDIQKWFRHMGLRFAHSNDMVGLIFQQDVQLGTYFLETFTEHLNVAVFRFCLVKMVHVAHQEFIVAMFPELDSRRKRARICQGVSVANENSIFVMEAIAKKRILSMEQRDLILSIVNSE